MIPKRLNHGKKNGTGSGSNITCDGGATCHITCAGPCNVNCTGATCDLKCAADSAPRSITGPATCS